MSCTAPCRLSRTAPLSLPPVVIPACRYALGSILGPTLGLWMVQGIGMRVTYAMFGCGIAAFRRGGQGGLEGIQPLMRVKQTNTLAAQRAAAESLWIQPVATGTIVHEQDAKCFWRQRPQSSKRCI